jgi:signal transduction histidine kinase
LPAVLFFGSAAQAQDAELGPSLICNTEQQVERFIALYDGDARAAINAVNKEAHDPTACGVVTTAYVRGRSSLQPETKTPPSVSLRYLLSVSSMRRGASNPLRRQFSTPYFQLRRSRFSGQSHRARMNDGNFAAEAAIALEITRRERQLREVQMELAHANRVATMGQLTASITHELKQPMAAARTDASAALRWLAKTPPDLAEV